MLNTSTLCYLLLPCWLQLVSSWSNWERKNLIWVNLYFGFQRQNRSQKKWNLLSDRSELNQLLLLSSKWIQSLIVKPQSNSLWSSFTKMKRYTLKNMNTTTIIILSGVFKKISLLYGISFSLFFRLSAKVFGCLFWHWWNDSSFSSIISELTSTSLPTLEVAAFLQVSFRRTLEILSQEKISTSRIWIIL